MTNSSWVVIVASGKDESLGPDVYTAFLNLQNRPILSYTLSACEHCPDVEGVIIVAPRDRLEQVLSIIQLYGCHKVRKIVPGANTQFASFQNGMKYVDDSAKVILMHEVSCPGITPKDLTDATKSARKNGVIVMGRTMPKESALVGKSGQIERYLDAGSIWTYGAPIGLSAEALKKMTAALNKKKKTVKTLMEAIIATNQKPRVVESTNYPQKIGTFEQYKEIDRVGLPLQ